MGTNPRRNRLTHADMLEIRALCERDDLTEEELGREFDRIEERANRRPKRRRHPRPSDDWPDDYRMQFWDAFPNRVGKKPALAALGRLRRRKQGKPTWAELIDGVHRYIEWHRAYGNGDNKWLNPKTWIVEERWNDQPAP